MAESEASVRSQSGAVCERNVVRVDYTTARLQASNASSAAGVQGIFRLSFFLVSLRKAESGAWSLAACCMDLRY